MCSDEGFYQVVITNSCAHNSEIKFHLNFVGACTSTTPNPAESRMVVVPEPLPGDRAPLSITMRYFGCSRNNQFDTRWHLGNGTCADRPLCTDDDGDDGSFICNRTVVSNCTFVSNFYIHNFSKFQSGNYTTIACPVFSGSISNISTVDLRKSL